LVISRALNKSSDLEGSLTKGWKEMSGFLSESFLSQKRIINFTFIQSRRKPKGVLRGCSRLGRV
jgi:hypothetical protein